MAAAFGLLRLSPDDFWSMTPRELERGDERACRRQRGAAPGRGELAALMRRFPDSKERTHG